MQAGLSVPYVANLENARGNPTLAALAGLAEALGAVLRVELADTDRPSDPAGSVELPESLIRFARLPRFAAETERLAAVAGQPVVAVRERLLTAMSGLGGVAGRPLGELDWQRILDVVILINHPGG